MAASRLRTTWRRRGTLGALCAVVSIGGLLLGSYQVHLFQQDLLPRLAPVVAARGETLALPIRLTIIVGNLVGNKLPLTIPGFLVGGVWIGLLWKPERPYGPALLLTTCVAALLSFQAVFLVTLFQMADYLPAVP